jgi:hypothetical protein
MLQEKYPLSPVRSWPDTALATKYPFHAAIALLASIYVLDVMATVFFIPELRAENWSEPAEMRPGNPR